MRRFRIAGTALGALTAGFLSASVAEAQGRVDTMEDRMLREAAAYESRGQLARADSVLQRLLWEQPGSTGAVFALERVLRGRGRPLDVLPAIRTTLERDPTSTGLRTLELNVLAEADSLDSVRSRAEAWMREERGSEETYREIARIYAREFGPEESVAVLRAGRSALGRDDALALEVGDLLAEGQDLDGAVREWASAVSADVTQWQGVSRRLQGLGDRSEAAGRALASTLEETGEAAERRIAVRVAIDLSLPDVALDVGQRLAGDLDERARVSFLSDVASRAREAGLLAVASWAYASLGEAGSAAERRQFDSQLVDAALAAGDLPAAVQAGRRVADSYPAGSEGRRGAYVRVLRLVTAAGVGAVTVDDLDGFRREFPDALELDEIVGAFAVSLGAAGQRDEAWAVLEGAEGPRASLERAYLHLDQGETQAARTELAQAVSGLPPLEATEAIQLSSLLGRLSPAGAAVLARSIVLTRRGRVGEGVTVLEEHLTEAPMSDRAALLAAGARLADDGVEPEGAVTLWERLLKEYPDAPEVGEGALALARYHARRPEGVGRAIAILEDFIARRPDAAVVPSARIELERLRGGA